MRRKQVYRLHGHDSTNGCSYLQRSPYPVFAQGDDVGALVRGLVGAMQRHPHLPIEGVEPQAGRFDRGGQVRAELDGAEFAVADQHRLVAEDYPRLVTAPLGGDRRHERIVEHCGA